MQSHDSERLRIDEANVLAVAAHAADAMPWLQMDDSDFPLRALDVVGLFHVRCPLTLER
jgi:hypothetical protein